MNKWEFQQDDTIYYLSFLFTDVADDKQHTFVKYFTWRKELNGTFSWTNIRKDDEIFINSIAKFRKIPIRQNKD